MTAMRNRYFASTARRGCRGGPRRPASGQAPKNATRQRHPGAIPICRVSGTTPPAHRCSDRQTSAKRTSSATRRPRSFEVARVRPRAIGATAATRRREPRATTSTGWTREGSRSRPTGASLIVDPSTGEFRRWRRCRLSASACGCARRARDSPPGCPDLHRHVVARSLRRPHRRAAVPADDLQQQLPDLPEPGLRDDRAGDDSQRSHHPGRRPPASQQEPAAVARRHAQAQEGSTLVVETTNFKAEEGVLFQGANPATFTITERFTRVARTPSTTSSPWPIRRRGRGRGRRSFPGTRSIPASRCSSAPVTKTTSTSCTS